MSETAVRTTVVLPEHTAKMLRRLVPARKRSAFIADAIRERLARIAWDEALARSFGAWSDEDHPDLRTREDMERHISELRSDESWRRPASEEE